MAATSVISDFRYDTDENCSMLGYYAASNGNFLPTFRDNLSGCPEITTTYCIITQKSAVLLAATCFGLISKLHSTIICRTKSCSAIYIYVKIVTDISVLH